MSDISIKEARARLWHMGILTWKLDPIQKQLYEAFQVSSYKTNVWSCSRRLGKSYALCCIAVEQCMKKPNTVVKFIAPTQKHVKNIIRPLLKEIFKDCPDELRPHFRTADNIYRFHNGSEIQLAGTDSGHAEGLRGGCLAEDTLVLTPNGPKEIKNINIGEDVYGFNEDGSISITQVVNKFDNGIQKVTEIKYRNKVLLECTDNHKWLTRSKSNCEMKDRKLIYHEKQFKQMDSEKDNIVRAEIIIPCGNVNIKEAYVLGA